MEKNQNILPLDIYYKHFKEIHGVKFTPRELDVMSCILNGRTAAIAGFLLIGKRAVDGYTSDIRKKAGGLTGRDQIIDFIEKSGKLSLIKDEYYAALRLRVLFEEKLNEIAKKVDVKSSSCALVYEKGGKYPVYLVPYLKEHLKRIGFEIKASSTESNTFFNQSDGLLSQDQMNSILYVLPENFDSSHLLGIDTFHFSRAIFLLQQEVTQKGVCEKLKDVRYVNMLDGENYYFSFFLILKKLLPYVDIESIIEEFKQQYQSIHKSSKITNSQEGLNLQVQLPVNPSRKSFFKKQRILLLVSLILAISILGFGSFMIKRGPQVGYHSLSSSVPRITNIELNAKTFLNRPELIAQIDQKFKGKEGIQTLALVGIGGAGKTTLVRQYAHQQKENVVWEINAETQESLRSSFKILADALAKTEETQKILNNFLDIKDSAKREESILSFVKEQLRPTGNWLLIFDNVGKFSDIQKYFPQDMNAWGQGKAMLTTRDSTIENNRQVNHTIFIRELSQEQKLNLFMQIMNHGETPSVTPTDHQEVAAFLEKIPPFPLDISVASYYLKTTKTSYKEYLKNLEVYTNEFTNNQKDIVEDYIAYLETRYGIITLSLEKMMNTHKYFTDLLLFISLLDSQNVPKSLLDKYKNPVVVDNFLHNLKKYSFIVHTSSSLSSDPSFSMHRSTQAIMLNYLRRKLNLDNNKELIKFLGATFGEYINDLLENWDREKLRELASHVEAFLSHDNLLTGSIKGALSVKLGGIYAIDTSNFAPMKAKNFLEKTLQMLNKNTPENYESIAQGLYFLGFASWDVGDFEKCKLFYEKSIEVYRKYFPEDQLNLARVLTSLSHVTRTLGYYEKSKNLVDEALIIYRHHHPENHVSIAWGLSFLGWTYYELGEYEKAKKTFDQSLYIYKKYYPKHYVSIHRIYLGLGLVHWKLSDYEKAKYYTENSIGICENFPKASYIVNCSKINLGVIYRDMYEYDKARKLLENGLPLCENYYGKDHFLIAYVLRNLGQLSLLENDIEKANTLFKRSLDIYQKTNHVDIYATLESLADLYIKKSTFGVKNNQKQSESFKIQAINYLRQAQEIVKAHFPPDSPHLIRIQSKLKTLDVPH